MKYLIYQLFSGVGFCNQLFSFETAIYLSNILKRKLILIVRNPLCHCGSARWYYGKFLSFLSDKYKDFLPFGLDVYYRVIPNNIEKKISECIDIFPKDLSCIGIIDENLNTFENQEKINSFLKGRTKFIFNIDSYKDEFIYTKKSNASRCFYNFFTTKENYTTMSLICKSLNILHDDFYKIEYPQNFDIAIHLRLGDCKFSIQEINKRSENTFKLLVNFLNKNKWNKKNILLMVDRENAEIVKLLKSKYKITMSSDILKTLKHNEVLNDNPSREIINFLIQKNICKNAKIFIGTKWSTVTNYINYVHYINNKPYGLYLDGVINHSSPEYTWINCYKSNRFNGHVISWAYFFPDNIIKNK